MLTSLSNSIRLLLLPLLPRTEAAGNPAINGHRAA